LADLLHGDSLGGRSAELAGRSVLLAAHDQVAAALALLALDGIAARIVICPPDIAARQLPFVIEKAGVDAVVSDSESVAEWAGGLLQVRCGETVTPCDPDEVDERITEWVLLTSGTTGAPKMIVHTLDSLIAPIDTWKQNAAVVWGTFYDIRRYGGMQIFLRAIVGGGSLVLSSAGEPVADHLARLAAHGVTHLSGTPSHWRRALMSPQARTIAPRYIRLSGEIADAGILQSLKSFYPQAAIGHAFASTEAGVAFEVNDGLAGFPASLLGTRGDVEMKIEDHTLRIRSNRVALRYLDGRHGRIADEQGFVDTGDVVELRDGRFHFLGRRNGVINVGGLKVYPEEVEAVINRHPAVRMSRVRSRKNPFTGALVSADIVLDGTPDPAADVGNEVREICRRSLEPHKVPATVRCVPSLAVTAAGKLERPHA
jgi:acyl-CoA synthetase (AMP-forming)/AMP-acid ligase II